MSSTHQDFRAFRAERPVVRIGPENSDYCYFGLDLGNDELFVFRDVFAHIEIMKAEKTFRVHGQRGIRGLLKSIVLYKLARPQELGNPALRLPNFKEWWDGNDEYLYSIMLLLLKSHHDAEEALANVADAITSREVADRVIQDNRFPARTRFTALHATDSETSIESLCAYVNNYGNSARGLHTRLEHAAPLIELLKSRGELERIRPAIEYVPKVFEWWNGYSGRQDVLEAVRILTGTTRR